MLFKSKFAKLEAFAAAKADDRTPDMLAAAQQELDNAGAQLILVPHTDTIKTGAQLEAHIESLENAATTARAEATKAIEAAQKDAAEAKKTADALKGKRVLETQKVTPDAGKGGDKGPETAEEKEARELKERIAELPHNKRARAILEQ